MDATIVQVSVAGDSLVYLQALLNGGILRGTHRKKSINPSVKPLLEALYHVLAGGTVEVSVTKSGDLGQVEAYKELELLSLGTANEINRHQPHGVVVCI